MTATHGTPLQRGFFLVGCSQDEQISQEKALNLL